MKNTNIYEEFIQVGKEMSKRSKRLADETHNLLTHLERSHKEVILQAKENLAVIKEDSEIWISKLSRLYPANEETK